MKIYYQNSRNKVVNFLSEKISIQDIDTLFNFDWKYSSVNSSEFGGKIDQFYMETKEKEFTVSIFADDENDFQNICENLVDVFEYDVRTLNPGRIYIGDYYLTCYVFGSSYSEFEDLMYATDKKFTLVAPWPAWIKETKYEYAPDKLSVKDKFLDYPIFYNYDYHNGLQQKRIENTSFMPSNFEIIIYGPCIDPMITIGNHVYEVNTELKESEYMIIDSVNKKLQKVLEDGTRESVFTFRNRNFYIYEKIPEGVHNVLWNGLFHFSITLFDERSEPKWI